MGHRLLSKQNGVRGFHDHVVLQRVAVDEIQLQAVGVVNGVISQFGNSTAGTGLASPPFQSGDIVGFEALVSLVVSAAGLAESPVTLGALDSVGEYIPLPWGVQYRPLDNSNTASNRFFELPVENLRRLKAVCLPLASGMYFVYNSFSRVREAGYTVPFPSSWTKTVFPLSFQVDVCSDNLTGEVVQLTPLVGFGLNTFPNYLSSIQDQEVLSASFVKWLITTAERDSSIQSMLTQFLRLVRPNLCGEKGEAFGQQVGVGFQVPWTPVVDILLSCVLPLAYVENTGNKVASQVAAACTFHNLRFWVPSTVITPYYKQLESVGRRAPHSRGGNTTSNELQSFFREKMDARFQ